MRHAIPADELGPRGPAMADAVGSCVHCGFCLPTCPTYQTLGEELDSPRGRIILIKEVLEGELPLADALPALDNCLGCRACETACPSGVAYGDLITAFRLDTERQRSRPLAERLQRSLALGTLPHPRRFRLAARLGMLARPLAGLLPDALAPMLALLPERLPKAPPLPAVYPAEGPRRARVALLAGCAQKVLDPDINWATLRVLARNGVETVIPAAQGCCGALAMHTGATEQATRLARRNLAAFGDDVDAVVTNAAGCGSAMREYGLLMRRDRDEETALALAARTRDVSEFLNELGLAAAIPPVLPDTVVAYHDACHLAHAQGVRSAPRALLAAIPGVTIAEPANWEQCCGSAGTYNIERPAIAAELGERKARQIAATGAGLVATGNIGCMTQVRTHLRQLGHQTPVLHTLQVLDRAYRHELCSPGRRWHS